MSHPPAPRVMLDNVRAVIHDLDNTHVRCSEYYNDARTRWAELMATELGLSPAESLGALMAVGRAMSLGPLGHSKQRFPLSMAETYRRLVRAAGRPVREAVAAAASSIGESVFAADYTPYAGSVETLAALHRAGIAQAICTKGDVRVQLPQKVDRHGYRRWVQHVRVCDPKTPEDFLACMHALGATPETTVVVGDSLVDDIAGATAAGMRSVWVTAYRSSTFSYLGENPETTHPTATIGEIHELQALLPALAPDVRAAVGPARTRSSRPWPCGARAARRGRPARWPAHGRAGSWSMGRGSAEAAQATAEAERSRVANTSASTAGASAA